MINKEYAKKYSCEDLRLIENYELAINDTTQTWDCHHRRESIYSAKDLIEIGEYWKRPAAELIFLTHSEHRRLHAKGIPRGPMSEAHKKALSEALKGVPLSEAHKKALSDAKKGVTKSEAHKKAIGKARSKKILQFTKSGEFIREWPSVREAERELGISHSSISGCCNGIRKSAGGYVWKYV